MIVKEFVIRFRAIADVYYLTAAEINRTGIENLTELDPDYIEKVESACQELMAMKPDGVNVEAEVFSKIKYPKPQGFGGYWNWLRCLVHIYEKMYGEDPKRLADYEASKKRLAELEKNGVLVEKPAINCCPSKGRFSKNHIKEVRNERE